MPRGVLNLRYEDLKRQLHWIEKRKRKYLKLQYETEVMLRKLKVKKIYLYFIQSAERQADFFNLATDWDGNLLANDGFEITFSHEAF